MEKLNKGVRLTFAQAAELLRVSRPRVTQLLNSREIEGCYEGGRRFVYRDSASAYLKSRRGCGRSRRDLKSSFMLMNATYEVMRVSLHPQSNLPLVREEVLDDRRCPWGVVTRGGNARRRELNDWWRARAVPAARPGIGARLAELQEQDTYALPFRSLGLSLSDSYWLRPMGREDLAWHDVNFFENDFVTSHDDGRDFWLERVGLDSPDNTSEGALPKTWTKREGSRLLIKGCGSDDQRPLNEVAATMLHERLLPGDAFVRYEATQTPCGIACLCADFLRGGEEYVPASAVMARMGSVRGRSPYDRYCRFVGMLGVDERAVRQHMAEMIVCDAIIANSDRHRRNFGLIRNVDTLEFRLSPLFDSGNCLWYDKTQEEVKRGDWRFVAKPFGSEPERQMALVEAFEWFDSGTLVGYAEEVTDFLRQSSHASQPERLDFIRRGMEGQVATVASMMSVLRHR